MEVDWDFDTDQGKVVASHQLKQTDEYDTEQQSYFDAILPVVVTVVSSPSSRGRSSLMPTSCSYPPMIHTWISERSWRRNSLPGSRSAVVGQARRQ